MAARPPGPNPQRIAWTVVVPIEPGLDCVLEAQDLDSLPLGSAVVLQLNDHRPYDIDPRVVDLVRSAWRNRNLAIELQGRLQVVGNWWHALARRPTTPPRPRARHLELVDGGDPA